ncbi:unnamed protein product [Owenia fusiformis]|nr:unnamed protein product [Owenia fusiformis]
MSCIDGEWSPAFEGRPWCAPSSQSNQCEGYEKSCKRGSYCTAIEGEPRCVCEEGWGGPLCDQKGAFTCGTACYNGDCVFHQASGTEPHYYTCDCDDGWMGDSCYINLNKCDSNPFFLCANGGTCDDSTGILSCLCPEGFGGSLCELTGNETQDDMRTRDLRTRDIRTRIYA